MRAPTLILKQACPDERDSCPDARNSNSRHTSTEFRAMTIRPLGGGGEMGIRILGDKLI